MEIKLTIETSDESKGMLGEVWVDLSKPAEEMSERELLTAMPALLGLYAGFGQNVGLSKKILANSAYSAILDNITKEFKSMDLN
jgi:hypothetical protein